MYSTGLVGKIGSTSKMWTYHISIWLPRTSVLESFEFCLRRPERKAERFGDIDSRHSRYSEKSLHRAGAK
jgi:hypothetical protein